jgi:hypothetical protein
MPRNVKRALALLGELNVKKDSGSTLFEAACRIYRGGGIWLSGLKFEAALD